MATQVRAQVRPVRFEVGRVAVAKVSLRNLDTLPLPLYGQYLLDMQPKDCEDSVHFTKFVARYRSLLCLNGSV